MHFWTSILVCLCSSAGADPQTLSPQHDELFYSETRDITAINPKRTTPPTVSPAIQLEHCSINNLAFALFAIIKEQELSRTESPGDDSGYFLCRIYRQSGESNVTKCKYKVLTRQGFSPELVRLVNAASDPDDFKPVAEELTRITRLSCSAEAS